MITRLRAETRYDELIAEGQRILEEFRQKYGVVIHDFSSPETYGGDPDGFYDAAHMNPHNAELVARALAGDFAPPGNERQSTDRR